MRKSFVWFLGLVTVLTLLFPTPVFAETGAGTEGKLSVRPLNIDPRLGYFYFDAAPGDTLRLELMITNESDRYAGSSRLLLSDAVTAVGGGMGVITPETAKRERVATWFAPVQERLTLRPGERRKVTLTLAVPSDATPGDHIGTVTLYNLIEAAQPSDGPNGDQAQLLVNKAFSQTIGVHVRIAGEPTHALRIGTASTQWSGEHLFLSIDTANVGNVLEKPTGTLRLLENGKEIFARDVAMDSIYPGTTGAYALELPENLKRKGTYEAELTWNYAGKTTKAALPFTLEAKDVKQAELAERATEDPNANVSTDAIVLEPKQLILIGAGAFILLLGTAAGVYVLARRRAAPVFPGPGGGPAHPAAGAAADPKRGGEPNRRDVA